MGSMPRRRAISDEVIRNEFSRWANRFPTAPNARLWAVDDFTLTGILRLASSTIARLKAM
jgi:hypothetical protein